MQRMSSQPHLYTVSSHWLSTQNSTGLKIALVALWKAFVLSISLLLKNRLLSRTATLMFILVLPFMKTMLTGPAMLMFTLHRSLEVGVSMTYSTS